MNMTLSLRNKVGVLLCLALFAHASQGLARDGEPRLDSAASAAVGVGFEVSHGDYGAGADATLVTVPLSVFLYPTDKLDITLEVPLLYLSSKSDSGVVVTNPAAPDEVEAPTDRGRRRLPRQQCRSPALGIST